MKMKIKKNECNINSNPNFDLGFGFEVGLLAGLKSINLQLQKIKLNRRDLN
jgi:hypothetical protein